MTRFLIFLFPGMMDMVVGSVLFVCSIRMADSGASATAVAGITVVWAITYMVVCQFVGHLITPRNAAWMLVGSSLAMVGAACAFILVPHLEAMYAVVMLQGIATSFFFVPFQIFMKTVERDRIRGLARSTALYTFSWSTGLACGPFVSGYILDAAGWQWCHGLNVLLGAATAMGTLCLRHHAHHRTSTPAEAPDADDRLKAPRDYSNMPDLAWLAWLCAGMGCLTAALIRGLFPATGETFGIPVVRRGTILALLSGTQALVGLSLLRSRTWMYRQMPVAMFGLLGFTGLLLFGGARHSLAFYGAAVCFGVYSGSFYFYFVFHSLVHPSRSARYLAINESVVGITSIIGPAGGGLLADHLTPSTPYFAAAVLVAGAVILQVAVHRRHAGAVRKALAI